MKGALVNIWELICPVAPLIGLTNYSLSSVVFWGKGIKAFEVLALLEESFPVEIFDGYGKSFVARDFKGF